MSPTANITMSVSVDKGGLPIDMKNAIATRTNITAMTTAGRTLGQNRGDPVRTIRRHGLVSDSRHQPADAVARRAVARHDPHQAPIEQNGDAMGILQEIVEIFRHP